jgi:archaellin
MPLLEPSSGLFGGQTGVVGIGATLVFAVSVVTASFGASALVETASDLHDKAQQTQVLATEPLVRGLEIEETFVRGDSGGIAEIALYVRPDAEAGTVDLNATTIDVNHTGTSTTLRTQDTEHGNRHQVDDKDIAKIPIVPSDDHRIDLDEDVEIEITVANDAATDASFTTPMTMGGQQYKVVR